MFRFYKRANNVIECYHVLSKSLLIEEYDYIVSMLGTNCIKESDLQINFNDYIEYGPHKSMVSPYSSNAVQILKKCGINIDRMEKTILVPKSQFNKALIDQITQTVYRDRPNFALNDPLSCENISVHGITDIRNYNMEHQLGFDEADIKFYTDFAKKLGRNLTDIELYDLAQSNSEHSRHWFFNGKLHLDGELLNHTLFELVKSTQKYTNNRSSVAFNDNASSLKGFSIKYFKPNSSRKYEITQNMFDLTFTAETHNFPTGVAPFPGASTGTGGRIRDTQSIGRGGLTIAGTTGYCVGNIFSSDYQKKNIRTLIEASNGASDYGNKFGEPVILGFCRAFGQTINNERIEWVKPIMFSGGIGQINAKHLHKMIPTAGDKIIKIGGPAYRIGIGGGAASSRGHDIKNRDIDLSAVQRGDPEMENKLNKVIRTLTEMPQNPIKSIHDQGAGGTGNVTKEIVYPKGANINLDNVNLGDNSLTFLELWVSEYQENNTILMDPMNIPILKEICERESLPYAVIGEINDTPNIKVNYRGQVGVDLPLESILGKEMPQKRYDLTLRLNTIVNPNLQIKHDIGYLLKTVMLQIEVGSKRFLTNKVDRSVTGLIAQQQCVGPLHMPLSNFAIVAQSHHSLSGGVTSIGEQPIKGLLDCRKMAQLAVGEMLTNMIFAKITSLQDIRCSGNWMWPNKSTQDKSNLYVACTEMCNLASRFGFAFDGGKDSLSMYYKEKTKVVKCPKSLVISGYAPTIDIRKKVTPDLKSVNNYIIYVPLSSSFRLGGSVLAQSNDQIGSTFSCPGMDNVRTFIETFNAIQKLIDNEMIVSGHDISDGGLIVALCEMALAGNLGIDIKLDFNVHPINLLFAEELGLLIETSFFNISKVTQQLPRAYSIGRVVKSSKGISIKVSENYHFKESVQCVRSWWEDTSFEMEKYQCNSICVEQEKNMLLGPILPNIEYRLPLNLLAMSIPKNIRKYKIAILRDEGSNGEREMASAFYMAGFQTFDICINDLIIGKVSLKEFRGIAFVGGFSYSDVFGAAKGWYHVITSNPKLSKMFNDFYQRTDTFSFGVCNGCQLMARLGWIPECTLEKNLSGRFESRFSTVRVITSNSIMLKNMEGLELGIWVAHGEGRFDFIDEPATTCLQYINSAHCATERYPFNPNGSMVGLAGLCSQNGRHLAMMPHPERTFLDWQMAYNGGLKFDKFTPWFKMFLNAYEWCDS